eukprot:CAMPEP_0196813656 /NCGR_PEP_ID=MMETSP1362-20130617/38184_1 /TAXON_ID=163516 /ORGANISM="Leptocylindrus danicus, Strain CCMP1856" /LENGTH=418 /DNA_ID=CAMNT_0042189989 /DNA_START=6 /DNA_END=1262 /DNA_ORIENTATION=+
MKTSLNLNLPVLLSLVVSTTTHAFSLLTNLAFQKSPAKVQTNLYAKRGGDKSDTHNEPRKAALEGVLNNIERSYGKGSIMHLGDSERMIVDCITSGALTLDVALGGGYPRGRVVEIYGPESSGKTTLALHAIVGAQRSGGMAAFIDAEHALDPEYAAKLGVDTDSLLISQPDSGEMALDIVDQLVRSSAVDIIVVDSVAALVPRAELEGDMSDQQIGLQARLMSKAMRKITGSLNMSQCTVIFLNQIRQKVGVIYGSPEVTCGGNALKFYSSVRLDIRRKEILPNNSGIKAKVKVVKNKIAPPFKLVELDILFGRGIDAAGCLLDAALELNLLERKGSYYAYKGNNFAQGRLNASEYLNNNPEIYEELLSAVRVAIVTGEDSVAASVAAKESDDIDIDTTPNMTLTGEEQEEFEATFE